MFKIRTLNNISTQGLERLPRESYEVASDFSAPDAILLRSFKMHDMEIPASLLAVGRAGAGTNNIPVAEMTERGIPVFNTPGANANSVKELVLAGLLLSARGGICLQFVFYYSRFETLVPPAHSRAHTLPPQPSTCSACRATAQASSLGSRQLMDGLGGHVARAFRRCSWSPTGLFSGGAHPQLFRKVGDPPFSRRHGPFPPRP